MPTAFRLAYVDLRTASLDRATSYYGDVLGLNVTESSSASSYLAVGLDHHSIALHAADRAGIGAIGLQVAGEADLGELSRRLTGMGLSPKLKQDARPGVPKLLELTDVGGHTFQLLPEIAKTDAGFRGDGVAPLRRCAWDMWRSSRPTPRSSCRF